MSHIVNKSSFIKIIIAFCLICIEGVCLAQHSNSDNRFGQTQENSIYLMPDTTLELPLFVVTDKELQDSISSAISQLEKNWNYNETYGYIFVLLFATFDNPDTMTISINPYSIRNLFPLATFRHLEYLKTIGCIRINGYIFLVDAYTWVSREEIYYYIKHTKESIKFELNTCGSIKPFAPMPFNRLVFSVHLQDNKKFIAPNDWDKYKDKVND